ncbi:MAG: hypothetical protein RLZZ398_1061 [Verrucomicrobiota bacterium]|jgi:hypothetical protein
MIESIHQQTSHAIWPICQVLGVPRSSYYHASEPTPYQSADLVIGLAIQSIFKRHRRRYGYRRLSGYLKPCRMSASRFAKTPVRPANIRCWWIART